jgi:uncharacterized membrane protein YcaP (DUF421 family)
MIRQPPGGAKYTGKAVRGLAIVFIRTLIVYFSLLIAMRLMGKRQLGEMELSEFVVAALIADLASHPLQDIGIPMLNGLIPIFTLFCLEVIISGVTMKSISGSAVSCTESPV